MKLGMIKPSLYVKLSRLTLTGKVGDKEYFLTWSYKNRYYSIAVTDAKTNKNIQDIRIVMNETILRTLVKFMEKVLKSKDELQYSLTSKSIDFDNKDSDTLLIRGKIIIGKKKVGEELINYIVLTNGDESVKFNFPLVPNKYYVFDKNGKEITKTEELSNTYLQSYIDCIEDIIVSLPKFTDSDIFDTQQENNGKSNRNVKKNKEVKKEESVDDLEDFL